MKTSLNGLKPKNSACRLHVRRAYEVMLASLFVLPAYAEKVRIIRELSDPQINNVGPGAGPLMAPAAAPAQPVSYARPQGGVTQGEGPKQTSVQVANTAPPIAARIFVAPSAPPPPTQGAGNTDTPVNAARTLPPKSSPGQGTGQEKPIMPGAGVALLPESSARLVVPSSTIPSTNLVNSQPTTPTGGVAPALLAPAGASPALTLGNDQNSSSANTAVTLQPTSPTRGNPTTEMSAGTSAFASLAPTMVEILPGVQKLSESMRELPATRQQSTEKDATTTVNSDKCVPVSLRPDSQRPGLSLVDLTGDGLIVSAVPDAHVQTVFTRAGYGQIDLSQTARWCIKQAAARALVRPSAGVGTSQAALLVQTGAGLQLMSQDQWLAHQASVKPLVTAMALSPKLTKSSKPTKLNKSTHRLVAKRSSKPVAGVAVSAARLPTATSKVSAGA